MQLTNTIRDAFVRSVMNDVPTVDYDEKIRIEATKVAVAALPPKVRAIWNDKDLRDFVAMHASAALGHWHSMVLPGRADQAKDAVEAVAAPLRKARDGQEEARKDLRQKIHAVAYSVRTRKALVDMLPEFEKYLPVDEAAANRSLPVVANVVSEFVKAGWPKDKKPARVAA